MFQNDEEFLTKMKRILGPTLLIIGLLSNVISIQIFNSTIMRMKKETQYLKLISFIDACLVTICSTQVIMEGYYDIDIDLLNIFTCKIHSFAHYFLIQLRENILALMCIDK